MTAAYRVDTDEDWHQETAVRKSTQRSPKPVNWQLILDETEKLQKSLSGQPSESTIEQAVHDLTMKLRHRNILVEMQK